MLPRHLQKQPHGPDWPAPHTRPVGTYFARGGRSSAPLTPSPSGTVEVSRHSDDATLGSKAPAQFCESHITARSAAVHRHMVHIRRRGAAQTRDENTMVRSLILTAALTVGLATVAQAGFAPHSIGNSDSSIVRVAEGCGPGWWRGPGGRCHPMAKGRACPRGYHLGPEGERCWPN
jgi:hypothetical protein